MNITEVLDAIDKLSAMEKRQVADALVRDEEADQDASVEERQAALHRRLLAEGIVKNIPTREIVEREFEPVPITGEPLSETIIRERR